MFVMQPLNVEWMKDGDYLTDTGDALLDLCRTSCLSKTGETIINTRNTCWFSLNSWNTAMIPVLKLLL